MRHIDRELESRIAARIYRLDGGHWLFRGSRAITDRFGNQLDIGRVLYEIYSGIELEPYQVVRTTCGQQGCIAPDHQAVLGRNQPAKRVVLDTETLQKRFTNGESVLELALKYRTSRQQIEDVLRLTEEGIALNEQWTARFLRANEPLAERLLRETQEN